MDKSGIDRCKLILGFMTNLALERFVASKLKRFECTRFNFAKPYISAIIFYIINF